VIVVQVIVAVLAFAGMFGGILYLLGWLTHQAARLGFTIGSHSLKRLEVSRGRRVDRDPDPAAL